MKRKNSIMSVVLTIFFFGIIALAGYFIVAKANNSENAKKYITSGTIVAKSEVTGGQLGSGKKIYRLRVQGEYELDGVPKAGETYFDVTEEIYNKYDVGDTFDSADSGGGTKGRLKCENCGGIIAERGFACPKCRHITD